jgi:hypothetical protein
MLKQDKNQEQIKSPQTPPPQRDRVEKGIKHVDLNEQPLTEGVYQPVMTGEKPPPPPSDDED